MRYLLDCNVLLALGLTDHLLHTRVVRWLQPDTEKKQVATCAITELAFIRIAIQTIHGYSVSEAQSMLNQIKRIEGLHFAFCSDDQSALQLPDWVSRSNQVTDGHLLVLARRHRSVLATLDEGIPDAFVIPR